MVDDVRTYFKPYEQKYSADVPPVEVFIPALRQVVFLVCHRIVILVWGIWLCWRGVPSQTSLGECGNSLVGV